MNHRFADDISPWLFGLVVTVAIVTAPIAWGSTRQEEPAARRIFQLAERLELEGKPAEAVREYRGLVDQFPGSDLAGEALFRIAIEAWRRGDVQATRSATATFSKGYVGSRSAAGVMILEAIVQLQSADDDAGLGEAAAILRRLPASFGRRSRAFQQWGQLGALMQGDLALLRGSPSEALAAYVTALDTGDAGSSPQSTLARLGMAMALLSENHWSAAAQRLQQVIEAPQTQASAAPTRVLGEALPGAVSQTYVLAGGVSRYLSRSGDLVSAQARRLATLVHRHVVGPRAGTPRWKQARRLPIGTQPWRDPVGISVSPDGRLVVVDAGAKVGRVLEAEVSIGQMTVENGRRPWFDPDGTAYVPAEKDVVLPLSNQRFVFNEVRAGKAEPLEHIVAGLRDRFGSWLLVDEDRRAVLRFSRDGVHKGGLPGSGNMQPVDIAGDLRGRLYVLDARERSVFRYDAGEGSAPTRLIRAEWRRPEALAVDALGQIYVLDREAKRLELYDPQGKRLESLGPGLPGGIELRNPRDVAVDAAGRVFIADEALAAVVVLE